MRSIVIATALTRSVSQQIWSLY